MFKAFHSKLEIELMTLRVRRKCGRMECRWTSLSTCGAGWCGLSACEVLMRLAFEREPLGCSRSWWSSESAKTIIERCRLDYSGSIRWFRRARPWLLGLSSDACAERFAFHRLWLQKQEEEYFENILVINNFKFDELDFISRKSREHRLKSTHQLEPDRQPSLWILRQTF